MPANTLSLIKTHSPKHNQFLKTFSSPFETDPINLSKPISSYIQSLEQLTHRPRALQPLESRVDHVIRENTPKDIKKRLKIEKAKDNKLNYCSVKEVLIKN